jgi:hypothetical protein
LDLLHPKYLRIVSWSGLAWAALLGIFGLSYQHDLSLTQTDGRALFQVIERAIQNGISPYQRQNVEGLSATMRFAVDELFYPPSFIALAAPFLFLGEDGVRALLLLAQVLCFGFILSRASKHVPDRYQAGVWLCPVAFLALFQTARFGQLSCFVCAAVLCFWDRWRAGRADFVAMLLLFLATVKPSISLALVVFLAFERNFKLLFVVGLIHVGATWIASTLTGVDVGTLFTEWLASLGRYRELPQNSPSESFVYGLSTLLYRTTGAQYSLDLLALPLSYVVWRFRASYTANECIALLLLVSFVVGAPHAYDFLLLLPALWSVWSRLEKSQAASVYILVSVMLLLPQRVLGSIGLSSFDSVLRVCAPMVLGLALIGRQYTERSDAEKSVVSERGGTLRTWIELCSLGRKNTSRKTSVSWQASDGELAPH